MNTTAEKTAVLCFAASPDQAAKIEELRVKDGKIVSRSEILGELVEIGLRHYGEKTDVERETTFPAYPNTVPTASHTRSSKRSMERSTRKSARTADSK